MIKLYQFPHSHFSEKARWALDFKKLPYEKINLVRGAHVKTTQAMGLKETTVPIIDCDGEIIQDSVEILNFLDNKFPENPLLSLSNSERDEALNYESELGEEIGFHTRRYFYSTLLDHPKLVSSFFLQGKPLITKMLFPFMFPFVKRKMVKKMDINPVTAKESEERLLKALDKLDHKLASREFLVGNNLSRLDITAASLLAPLCFPPEHDFQWPEENQIPEPLLTFRNNLKKRNLYNWVLDLYRNHRH